jgi:hypothetical protein
LNHGSRHFHGLHGLKLTTNKKNEKLLCCHGWIQMKTARPAAGTKRNTKPRRNEEHEGVAHAFLRVLRFFVVKYHFVRSTNSYLEKFSSSYHLVIQMALAGIVSSPFQVPSVPACASSGLSRQASLVDIPSVVHFKERLGSMRRDRLRAVFPSPTFLPSYLPTFLTFTLSF